MTMTPGQPGVEDFWSHVTWGAACSLEELRGSLEFGEAEIGDDNLPLRGLHSGTRISQFYPMQLTWASVVLSA
jgi:hypothetical protein